MINLLLNNILMLLYKKDYYKYLSAGSNIYNVQQGILLNILKKNKLCKYGIEHNFANISSREEYSLSVPLSEYDDYLPYIEDMKNGSKNILTSDDILLFELTSGTSGGKKFIPYTKGLKDEFLKGIKVWIYSLYNKYPKVKKGKSYWSITPLIDNIEYTKGGIPVGFEEDSSYFGIIEKHIIDKLFAVKNSIKKEKSIDNFYLKTAVDLLNCKNLTLISVWSPTFLLELIGYIEQNSDRLMQFINKKRRTKIYNYIKNKEYNNIWPNLEVISCWLDGISSRYKNNIQNLFPDTYIEAKGVLSTEAFISLPFGDIEGSRISYLSHFYEFLNIDDNKIYYADNLLENNKYEVIVTTSGGLYRYRTNDIIEVVCKKQNQVVIRFVGRKGIFSDITGEKLSIDFVENIFKDIIHQSSFFMAAPLNDRYVIYIKDYALNKIDADRLLRQNFHFDYARKLGQLKETEVYILTGNPEKEYNEYYVKKGIRLGDIKLKVLSLEENWYNIFTGYFL